MRTYAPASTRAVLEQLLEEPSLARGVVHHEVRAARAAEHGEWPSWLDPRIRAGLASRGIERPVHPPGGRHRGGPRRPGRRRGDAHRVGQVAVLHGARPAGPGRGSVGAGAVPVPHQGPRPGPGRRVRGARRGRRPGGLLGLLRRGHAGAHPLRDPQGRARSWSPTRTCSTRRSSPTTPSGSSCSSSCGSSSSTSCTRTAACSGRTSRTCCAACSACAPTTAPTR